MPFPKRVVLGPGKQMHVFEKKRGAGNEHAESKGILGREKIKMADGRSFFYCVLRYGCWWQILDRASVLCQLKRGSFAWVTQTGKTLIGGIVQNSYLCWAGDCIQDDAQVCSSMKRWRWRNSEASHIAEKFIPCFQKCSWSIFYVTGEQPIDYNL